MVGPFLDAGFSKPKSALGASDQAGYHTGLVTSKLPWVEEVGTDIPGSQVKELRVREVKSSPGSV